MFLLRGWPSLLSTITFPGTAGTAIFDNNQQFTLAPEHLPSPSVSTSWDFNFSSLAPHYFASVQGLLQQWPNTFFPNGFAIAPCEVPPFTKFYHGRIDDNLPESPEWLAFDIEMAYGIMGSTRSSHILTYQTTRPTKAIYFDGESATLIGGGRMDTQMLYIYLNTTGAPWDSRDRNRHFGLWEEYDRAIGLCAWIKEKGLGGNGWGFEGIARMNAGFEMIWCDFSSSSLKLVSHLNVTAPLLPPVGREVETNYETSYFPLPPAPTRSPVPADPMPPPNWRRDTAREPFLRSQGWGWFASATNHYGFSGLGPGNGETRLKLLTCGIMSYYSTDYQGQAIALAEMERKTLNLTDEGLWIGPGKGGDREVALKELMRRRRNHRLDGISVGEASAMRMASEKAFSGIAHGTTDCSGLDWAALMNEIVQRHATDLFNLLHILTTLSEKLDPRNQTELQSGLKEIRDNTHTFLLPFLEYPSKKDEEINVWTTSSNFSQNTYSRCRYHHTRLLTPEFSIQLNPQETNLKWAVEETFGGICSVMIKVGFGVEELWEQQFPTAQAKPTTLTKTAAESEMETANTKAKTNLLLQTLHHWTQGIEELMSWLGWAGHWVRCEKQCQWDEKCFIPMWPMVAREQMPGRGGGDGPHGPPPDGGGERPSPPETANQDWDWDLFGGGGGDGDDGDGKPQPPGDKAGRRRPGPGGGRRRGRRERPGWRIDESDLWEPKCVKADYIMGP